MPLAPVAGALRERALAKLLPQNALLGALPVEVSHRLLPHLALADLRAGHELGEPGGRCARAFFPVAGAVCLTDGKGRAAAWVGSEGAVGLPEFIGDAVPMRPVVQFAGYGLALGREQLLEEWGRGGSLMRLLMRYARALGAQRAELARCRTAHALEQQLASLLLQAVWRLPAQEVTLPIDAAARLLGTAPSEAAAAGDLLRAVGAAAWRGPGLLAAHDGAALSRVTCGCAGRIDAAHRQVTGPEAATARPGAAADLASRRARREAVAAMSAAADRPHG